MSSFLQISRKVVQTTLTTRIVAELYQPTSKPPRISTHQPVDLILLHANGIPKQTWIPVVERLFQRNLDLRTVCAFDSRTQGDSGLLNDQFKPSVLDWMTGVEDLAALISKLEIGKMRDGKLVGVGHSFGGAITLYTETQQPKTFDSIVAIEPVIIHPEYIATGKWDEYLAALAGGSRRRRAVFTDMCGIRSNSP
ncbi:hypothetical protein HDU93_004759 [Gonapodya sp. JEL0774]|nr:hypothetical protein HDU93_004759 [Gonapodya sp. JEL0774]